MDNPIYHFPPKRATQMTEEEFVRDPIHRATAALCRVFERHLSLGPDAEMALLVYLQAELGQLTDAEMRDRYHHFRQPDRYEHAEHIANEFKPLFEHITEKPKREEGQMDGT
jgi:hypothetical protein